MSGTASIPTVKDVLSPRCFDFSKQLETRGQQIETADTSIPSLEASAWERRFNDTLGKAIARAGDSNPCYQARTTYGGFWDWIGIDGKGGTKLTRGNKGDKFRDLDLLGECNKRLGEFWNTLSSWWTKMDLKASGEKGWREESDCQNLSDSSTWSKLAECVITLSENEKNKEKMRNSGEKIGQDLGNEDWAKLFNADGIHDKVVVKVRIPEDGSWGKLGESACQSVTRYEKGR